MEFNKCPLPTWPVEFTFFDSILFFFFLQRTVEIYVSRIYESPQSNVNLYVAQRATDSSRRRPRVRITIVVVVTVPCDYYRYVVCVCVRVRAPVCGFD